MPARMTIVKLSDGSLFVHSPLPLTEKRRGMLDKLGEVKYIVSPNLHHHLYVGTWFNSYPNAKFFAAPALAQKRSDIKFDGILTDRAENYWGTDLDQFTVKGNPDFNEVVFYHRNTKTLIVADLLMHFCEPFEGVSNVQMAVLKVNNVQNKVTAPFESFWRVNKAAMLESIDLIMEWPFQRIILCHGKLIEKDAHKVFKEAYSHLDQEE